MNAVRNLVSVKTWKNVEKHNRRVWRVQSKKERAVLLVVLAVGSQNRRSKTRTVIEKGGRKLHGI